MKNVFHVRKLRIATGIFGIQIWIDDNWQIITIDSRFADQAMTICGRIDQILEAVIDYVENVLVFKLSYKDVHIGVMNEAILRVSFDERNNEVVLMFETKYENYADDGTKDAGVKTEHRLSRPQFREFARTLWELLKA